MGKKLLMIELEDINSVPKVVYRGKDLSGKIQVSFDWKTNDVDIQPTYIKIEHADKENDQLDVRTIIIHNEPIDDKRTIEVYTDDGIIHVLNEIDKDA